jgi:hypothetical protein
MVRPAPMPGAVPDKRCALNTIRRYYAADTCTVIVGELRIIILVLSWLMRILKNARCSLENLSVIHYRFDFTPSACQSLSAPAIGKGADNHRTVVGQGRSAQQDRDVD